MTAIIVLRGKLKIQNPGRHPFNETLSTGFQECRPVIPVLFYLFFIIVFCVCRPRIKPTAIISPHRPHRTAPSVVRPDNLRFFPILATQL